MSNAVLLVFRMITSNRGDGCSADWIPKLGGYRLYLLAGLGIYGALPEGLTDMSVWCAIPVCC